MARRNFFYKKITLATSQLTFPNKNQIDFGFHATHVIIVNDNVDNSIEFSFRKPNLDGEIFCSDGPLVMDGIAEDRLWFRVVGTPTETTQVRIWAWRR